MRSVVAGMASSLMAVPGGAAGTIELGPMGIDVTFLFIPASRSVPVASGTVSSAARSLSISIVSVFQEIRAAAVPTPGRSPGSVVYPVHGIGAEP